MLCNTTLLDAAQLSVCIEIGDQQEPLPRSCALVFHSMTTIYLVQDAARCVGCKHNTDGRWPLPPLKAALKNVHGESLKSRLMRTKCGAYAIQLGLLRHALSLEASLVWNDFV